LVEVRSAAAVDGDGTEGVPEDGPLEMLLDAGNPSGNAAAGTAIAVAIDDKSTLTQGKRGAGSRGTRAAVERRRWTEVAGATS
jgi:hypothetical protein